MKIIQIIPAPPGSQIVEGPWCDEEFECDYEPCACLALIEDNNYDTIIIPVGFGEQFSPEFTHRNAELFPDIESAKKEIEKREAFYKKRKNK